MFDLKTTLYLMPDEKFPTLHSTQHLKHLFLYFSDFNLMFESLFFPCSRANATIIAIVSSAKCWGKKSISQVKWSLFELKMWNHQHKFLSPVLCRSYATFGAINFHSRFILPRVAMENLYFRNFVRISIDLCSHWNIKKWMPFRVTCTEFNYVFIVIWLSGALQFTLMYVRIFEWAHCLQLHCFTLKTN